MVSLMWNLRTKQMSKRKKKKQRGKKTKKQTLNYREQTDGCQRGGMGG